MTTITQGGTTLTPTLVLGYESERESGNIVHPIIGTGIPDITFGPASLRTGTLTIFCLDHAAALAVEALHLVAGYFVLADVDLPGINMKYVPAGKIAVKLDDARKRWTVEIDFQEVPA